MLNAKYAEGCLRYFESRRIKCAFHDIDGTHSLIRNWPPVMSAVLNDVIENGLPNDFDSEQNVKRLISLCGTKPLIMTDRFCVESAGMSALTQMEWAIRWAVVEGNVKVNNDECANVKIIGMIESGLERFDGVNEPSEMRALIENFAPRLFRLYERVLNGFCRDKNLEIAKREPERFRVKGSMEFMKKLSDAGVKNYFVTGAVVEKGMGMFEEVEALGYKIGKGQPVEDIIGSSWDKKLPKDEIMLSLLQNLGVSGDEVLVTGDGRSEISAGVNMGALTVSRLGADAKRQRQLHISLGTHMIVEDFTDALITKVFDF